jgi:hypothetical protein
VCLNLLLNITVELTCNIYLLCLITRHFFKRVFILFSLNVINRYGLCLPGVRFERKVKLSLCLTNHCAMNTYWESGGIIPRILDLDTRWRWVVSFTPRPFYPQGKSPQYPVHRKLGGGPRVGLDTAVKRKVPSLRLGSNPRTPIVQPVAQSLHRLSYDDSSIEPDLRHFNSFHISTAYFSQIHFNIILPPILLQRKSITLHWVRCYFPFVKFSSQRSVSNVGFRPFWDVCLSCT